ANVDGERADKHERCIKGTVEPGTVVEAYAHVALQIGKAKVEHAAGKGDEPGASDDSQDTEKRTRRYFGRDNRGGGMRDLYRRRANRDGRGYHKFRSVLGMDGRHHGKSRAQLRRQSRIVQCNLHWNTLHYFCEIASGIIGGQQSELRSAGWRDLDHFAANELSGIFVNMYF